MKNNIIILDLETGGLKYNENPITQVGLTIIEPIHFDDLSSYSTFVKPYNNLIIEKAALEASRVSMKEINNGLTIDELMKKIVPIFKGAAGKGRNDKPILAGHNFGFDMDFLVYLFNYKNLNLFDYVDRFFYDTLKMFGHLEANIKNADKNKYNLTNLSERYGLSLTSAHGAMSDVKITKQLLMIYLNKVRNASSTVVEESGDSGRGKEKARDRFLLEF